MLVSTILPASSIGEPWSSTAICTILLRRRLCKRTFFSLLTPQGSESGADEGGGDGDVERSALFQFGGSDLAMLGVGEDGKVFGRLDSGFISDE